MQNWLFDTLGSTNLAFNLETVLDIVDAPPSVKSEFRSQNDKRRDLRSRCEAFANIPRPQNLRLANPTPGMKAAWQAVSNTELPREPRSEDIPGANASHELGLHCRDPRLIAQVLEDLQILNDKDFEQVIADLALLADLSVKFGEQMAQLIAESFNVHKNQVLAAKTRSYLGYDEAFRILLPLSHDENGPCDPIETRALNRLEFFGALYKNGVVKLEEYMNHLKALATSRRPCTCRLEAMHILVRYGDERSATYSSRGLDVGCIVGALLRTDCEGHKVWELKEVRGAAEGLKKIHHQILSWGKA